MVRVIGPLIDSGLDPETTDPTLMRQVRSINVATLAMFCFGVPFAFQYWSLGVPHMSGAIVATMAGCAFNLALLRRTRRADVSGHLASLLLYCLLVISNASSGGFYDPNFAWLYVVPLSAAVLIDLRASWLWVGVVSLTTLGFWWAHQVGIAVPNVIPEDQRALQSLFNRISAIVSIGIMTGSFVTAQRRTEQRLAAANAHLRQETAYVQLLREGAEAASRALTVEELLESCVKRVCAATGWPVGHAYVPADDGSGTLYPIDVWHLADEERFEAFREVTMRTPFEPGVGLPGRVYATRMPAWIVDVLKDDNFPRARYARDIGVKAAFGFPITVDGEIQAVLEFFAVAALEPDERMLAVSSDLGKQIGRVAERLDLEEQLRRTGRMRAVGQLAAGVAHEINNPIAYVRSNLAHLERELASLETQLAGHAVTDGVRERVTECRDVLGESVEGVERAAHIVRDMKACSNPTSAVREPARLDHLAANVLRMIDPEQRGAVEIETRLDDLPPIRCAPQQIEQVLLNLVTNAIQATGGKGRIRILGEARGSSVVVFVSDDGPGIPPELIDRIFDPFFTTKTAGEGTGLGLAICGEIVRMHEGELSVDSDPGQGSTFSVRLPI